MSFTPMRGLVELARNTLQNRRVEELRLTSASSLGRQRPPRAVYGRSQRRRSAAVSECQKLHQPVRAGDDAQAKLSCSREQGMAIGKQIK